MKSFFRTALLLVSALFVGAGVAQAQVIDRMTFTTSFPFVAAGKTLPAGTYTIEPVGNTPAVIALTGDRRTFVLMKVDAASLPRGDNERITSEVLFTKLEDGEFALSEVRDEGMQNVADIAWTTSPHAGEAAPARR